MGYRFPEAGLSFLADLSINNNKEWFHQNKVRYERDLKQPARDLVEAVNGELSRISPGHVTPPNKAVNRINRDIRFAKDKTPYNTKVWAGFSDQGAPKGSSAGFYFGFSLERVGVGCGLWAPDKERLERMRAHFAAHYARYYELAERQGFAKTYQGGQSPRLVRVPKPYEPDHPAAELLKLKGMHVSTELNPALITSEELVPTIGKHFEQLAPLVALLGEAMS